MLQRLLLWIDTFVYKVRQKLLTTFMFMSVNQLTVNSCQQCGKECLNAIHLSLHLPLLSFYFLHTHTHTHSLLEQRISQYFSLLFTCIGSISTTQSLYTIRKTKVPKLPSEFLKVYLPKSWNQGTEGYMLHLHLVRSSEKQHLLHFSFCALSPKNHFK